MPAEQNQRILVPVPDPTVLTTAQLLRENDALRELLGTRIDALRDLHQEKFSGIQQQFIDSQKAIDAALQAAKQAVEKSELSATKQIDAINDKVQDLKDRIGNTEGRSKGIGVSGALVFSVVAALASVGSIIGLIVVLSRH